MVKEMRDRMTGYACLLKENASQAEQKHYLEFASSYNNFVDTQASLIKTGSTKSVTSSVCNSLGANKTNMQNSYSAMRGEIDPGGGGFFGAMIPALLGIFGIDPKDPVGSGTVKAVELLKKYKSDSEEARIAFAKEMTNTKLPSTIASVTCS